MVMTDTSIYTVGWITALHTEHAAARLMLDREYKLDMVRAPHDNNTYTIGRMGRHRVVIAVCADGEYGTTSAAIVARDLVHAFPNIKIGLVVGIAGGAPTVRRDIRLGDVVVSSASSRHAGAFHHDFGKRLQADGFSYTGLLNRPPPLLRTAVADLRSRISTDGHDIRYMVNAALEDKRDGVKAHFQRPSGLYDRLYTTDYIHEGTPQTPCRICCEQSWRTLVRRESRKAAGTQDPMVHYGIVATGDTLVKDATYRDQLAKEMDILCFEMEAGGLMNHFSCLVIRGICDYSDTHKNDTWHGYAAMTAAAYAKSLLSRINPDVILEEEPMAIPDNPRLTITGTIPLPSRGTTREPTPSAGPIDIPNSNWNTSLATDSKAKSSASPSLPHISTSPSTIYEEVRPKQKDVILDAQEQSPQYGRQSGRKGVGDTTALGEKPRRPMSPDDTRELFDRLVDESIGGRHPKQHGPHIDYQKPTYASESDSEDAQSVVSLVSDSSASPEAGMLRPSQPLFAEARGRQRPAVDERRPTIQQHELTALMEKALRSREEKAQEQAGDKLRFQRYPSTGSSRAQRGASPRTASPDDIGKNQRVARGARDTDATTLSKDKATTESDDHLHTGSNRVPQFMNDPDVPSGPFLPPPRRTHDPTGWARPPSSNTAPGDWERFANFSGPARADPQVTKRTLGIDGSARESISRPVVTGPLGGKNGTYDVDISHFEPVKMRSGGPRRRPKQSP